MSNHSINPFGGGLRHASLRSLRIGRRGYSLGWVVGLLIFASTAWMAQEATAAEIVEVRVGRHAEFTRVVFELDRAVGYRLERADPTSGAEELVVSLEASSIPRHIQSSKSLIIDVDVSPSGDRSVARIRLAKDGLRLKEMILTSPPRIVLDVFSDEKIVSAVAATAKATPEPKKEAVPSLDEPTFDEIVAQIPEDAEPAQEIAPIPVATTSPQPPTAPPGPQMAEPAELNKGITETAAAAEPSTSIPIEEPEIAPEMALIKEPVELAPEPTRTTRPMVVKSKPTTDEGRGWMSWALLGFGAVALALGGLLVARRARGGNEVDFSDEDQTDSGDGITMPAERDDNPFGNLASDDSQMTLGSQDEAAGISFDPNNPDDGDTTIVSLPDEEKESESVVFGDTEENNMEDMEVISREQVNESLGGMPSGAGGIPEEFQQMVREMNRRVESLEGRIDELVDARDRLERQVAAQTEELRVQRAAIARTQRAVRNLARPEDGEGDQEPTEPAIRDPN
jgi:hypothetical protein